VPDLSKWGQIVEHGENIAEMVDADSLVAAADFSEACAVLQI